jgi:hypothetical protein
MILAQSPGKRTNRPFEVLELDLSGFPTTQELAVTNEAGEELCSIVVLSD